MKKLFVLSVSALLAGAMIVSCSKKQVEAPAADSDSVAVVEVADSAVVVDTVAVDSVVVEEPKAEEPKPAMEPIKRSLRLKLLSQQQRRQQLRRL